ncbi:hypothetical protein KSD_92300 [Ktedonobacter sp. SOSP1-85]|nr:hypothetical protein KSD_92300 [Ktedonobacter sp. SOSP1-85]
MAIPAILIFQVIMGIQDSRDPADILAQDRGREGIQDPTVAPGAIPGRKDLVGIQGSIQAPGVIQVLRDQEVILAIHSQDQEDTLTSQAPMGIPAIPGNSSILVLRNREGTLDSQVRMDIPGSQARVDTLVNNRDLASSIRMATLDNSQVPMAILVLRNRGRVDILVHRQNHRANTWQRLCPRPPHRHHPCPRRLHLRLLHRP